MKKKGNNSQIAVFIDRDGTINEEMGYINHVSRLHLLPYAGEAIRRFNRAGIKVIIVSNQSGVARGIVPRKLVDKLNAKIKTLIKKSHAKIDGVLMCFHGTSENCNCRKPKPGMLLEAEKKFGLNLRKCYTLGDKYIDVKLGHNVGAKGVLVLTGYGPGELLYDSHKWEKKPDFIAKTLRHAAGWIIRDSQK
ncbi:MAG: HAD family hydrolase [Elusimicrobiota bacterium]